VVIGVDMGFYFQHFQLGFRIDHLLLAGDGLQFRLCLYYFSQ